MRQQEKIPPRPVDPAVKNAKASGIARISALLAILVFCSSEKGAALDPHQPLSQLYHSSWTSRQGVNGNVTALAQTTDGYLWAGTSDGLLRFDGISLEEFRPENGSLINTSVSTLFADPDGGLWVGFFKGGASFLKNGRVTNYSDSEGFPVSSVRCFARDRSGAIWAAVVGGLARLQGQSWHYIAPTSSLNERRYNDWNYPDKSAWNLLVDRDGTLWVATGSQITFLPRGEKRFQSSGIQVGKVSVLRQAPDGTIWFSDDQNRKLRSFRFDGGGRIEILHDIDISAETAVFDRDGALWIGGHGLSRIPFPGQVRNPAFKAVERFNERDGLSNSGVEDILEDREGNIWVGTDGGLDRFRHRRVTWFPLSGDPFSLVARSGGDVWAGSGSNFPVVRVQDRKPVVGSPTNVFTVYRDPDGSLWYGTDNSLSHLENGVFIRIRPPSEVLKLSLSATPPDPMIASSITKDHSGNLWVAFGGSGEFRFKNGTWNFVRILPDHQDWSAAYAFTDRADRIWLCWGDRIARYDHGDIRIFGAKEGLQISPSLITEHDEQIWAAGESGLSLFQGERFHTIQTAEGTSLPGINGIVATDKGSLWLSTSHGILHIPETEIEEVIHHPEHKVAFELYDQISDLPEPIQWRADVYSSTAVQADDGTIWFAMRNGAVQVDPSHIFRNPLPPPVSIRSIVADAKSYSPFSNPALPALTKNLRIEYAALSLSIPERVRFRYKLEGWDNEWHEAGGRREAIFTNLPPKRYSFRVIACNDDGVWNETGTMLNFTVAPAWFETMLFRAFCTAVFLVLLWCLYQLRLRQLQQKFTIGLEARVNERARIARDLHDTLLQSFQGLMLRLQLVEDLLPGGKAKNQLEESLQRADQAIAEGRRAVYELRSSIAVPTDLAQAVRSLGDEFATENSAAFDLVVEGTGRDLNPIVRDELYLITREALRNAFSHARAQHIEAEITYGEWAFRLRIRDDGEGIPTHILEGGRSGHYGLSGMRERAKQVGGKLELWSRAGAGTEIDLSIPGSVAYRTSVARSLFSFARKKAG